MENLIPKECILQMKVFFFMRRHDIKKKIENTQVAYFSRPSISVAGGTISSSAPRNGSMVREITNRKTDWFIKLQCQ